MCLIVMAWRAHPEIPLLIAANRDEFHSRPTCAAHWWKDRGDILAGRDLVAGGTWIGITRSGRFAAVTNYRDPAQRPGRCAEPWFAGELVPGVRRNAWPRVLRT